MNQVQPYSRTDGSGGFWMIKTAAEADWPSQSRLLEVMDNQDGTLSIRAFASSMNGVSFLEGCITGDAAEARATGGRLARELASRGARELLQP